MNDHRLLLPGTGDKFMYVLASAVDEANLNERGWASLEGLDVIAVVPWRVIFEVDTELDTRHPVALIGVDKHGWGLRRKYPGPVINEIWDSLDDPRRERHYRQVTAAELARMFGVRPGTVRQWLRRHPDFPRPLLTSRRPLLWDRREAWEWGRRTGRIRLGRHDRRVDSRSLTNPSPQ